MVTLTDPGLGSLTLADPGRTAGTLTDPGREGVLGTVAWGAVCGTEGRRTSSAAASGVRAGFE